MMRNIFWSKMEEVTGGCIMTNFVKPTISKYYQGNQIIKNWAGRAYDTYEGQERCILSFVEKHLEAGGHVESLVVDGRLIAKWINKERVAHGLD